MDEQQNIIIYQSEDGVIRLDVRIEEKTVWLTIDQMSELFANHVQQLTNTSLIYMRKGSWKKKRQREKSEFPIFQPSQLTSITLT